MELIPITNKDHQWFKPLSTLYDQAFPSLERRDMDHVLMKIKEGLVFLYAAIESNTFIGLTMLSKGKRFDMMDYLAIDKPYRNHGYGSQVLQMVLTMYNNQPLFIEIEDPYQPTNDQAQKLRRYHFYINNGLTNSGLLVNLYHVDYLILTNGQPITYADYIDTYRYAYGPTFLSYLQPKYIGQTKETL